MTPRTRFRIKRSCLPCEVRDGIWVQHGMGEQEYMDWIMALCRKMRQRRYYLENKDRILQYHKQRAEIFDASLSHDFYVKKESGAEQAYNKRKAREEAWNNHVEYIVE